MAYVGQRMSERAVMAYEDGEKPLSKWTKSDIVELVLEKRNDFEEKELNKYNKESLKAFLTCSSWHHTGSYFNNTDFYSLDEDFIELSKDEIVEVLNNRMSESKKAKEAKKEEKLQKCFITYVEWEGTRKHPKAVDREAYGIIKGNWVHTEYGKKSLNGKYVHVVKEFDKAPRGTAQIFKNIEEGLR